MGLSSYYMQHACQTEIAQHQNSINQSKFIRQPVYAIHPVDRFNTEIYPPSESPLGQTVEYI